MKVLELNRVIALLLPIVFLTTVFSSFRSISCQEDNDHQPALDPMDFSYQTLWQFAKSECEKRGFNASIITRSWIDVRRCFRKSIDVVQFNTDSIRLNVDNQQAVLEKHCPNLMQATSCFGPFMITIRDCVPDENYEIFEALQQWITGVLEYICEDNGKNIVYDRVKHENCTKELNNYIFMCAMENIMRKQYDDRKSFNQEDCSMIVRTKNCLVNKLAECSVFKAAAELFYENFVKITSCINQENF
ncbi:uncharacterized protein LOC129750793 [Uranotaenia lowii]|uniref:uncharacterized protein LOC129750793 n=1 Tax=Uranotaenia lowii TaxID=190385 RepID=UPI00247A1ADA|nr:uncharacterized protein LOC129750793 [Uranotaenia lowii]